MTETTNQMLLIGDMIQLMQQLPPEAAVGIKVITDTGDVTLPLLRRQTGDIAEFVLEMRTPLIEPLDTSNKFPTPGWGNQ